MVNPFNSVTIVPDYDSASAVIEWEVNADYKRSLFVVQKSEEGFDFISISGTPRGNIESFKDNNYYLKSNSRLVYYRIMAILNSHKYYSQVIEPYYRLRPRDYAVARHIIRSEKTRIGRATGIVMSLKKRLYTGDICSCVDLASGLSTGKSDCELCFGTGITGGYGPDMSITLEIQSVSETLTNDAQMGFNINEFNILSGRAISYPRVNSEDILLDYQRRKVYVASAIKHARFKGIIPVSCAMMLQELPYNDVRYKLLK